VTLSSSVETDKKCVAFCTVNIAHILTVSISKIHALNTIQMSMTLLHVSPPVVILMNCISHFCWCNCRTFWRKNAAGRSPTVSCSCMKIPPAHHALANQKKLAYLGFQCLDRPPFSPDLAPSEYHLFPGLKKNIEMSPFFVRRGGHSCRGGLVEQANFWFFVLSSLQKLEQRTKKCIVKSVRKDKSVIVLRYNNVRIYQYNCYGSNDVRTYQ